MKDNYLSQENLKKKIIKDMEQQNPDEVFNKYYKQVENLNLCSYTIKSGETFYRGRKGFLEIPAAIDDFNTVIAYPYYGSQIEAPPPIQTRGGRFNRDGYSYLYLTSDRETCVAEIHLEVQQVCSIAQFKCIKDGKYLQLIPDPNYQDEYELMMYHILTQPIHSEIQYKYRLTQLFSDIIKRLGYRGIYFKSTQANGYNIVCFYPQDFDYIEYSERMITAKKIQYTIEEVQESYKQYHDYRRLLNSYNSEIEEIRENQIEHITKRQEFDDQMKFLQLKTDALSEMRPKIKMQKFNKLIEFAKDIPSLKKDAFVLRGTFLMKSGKSQTRAIEDLIEGFSSLHTVNEDSAVSKTTEYILENGLIPGTSDHDIEQLVKNIFEKRKKRLDKKHQCLVKSVAKLVAQQGS